MIVLPIQPDERLLLAGQVEVQFHGMGVEFDGGGGVEAVSSGVQSVTHAGIVGGILCDGRGQSGRCGGVYACDGIYLLILGEI